MGGNSYLIKWVCILTSSWIDLPEIELKLFFVPEMH
jgi:hypothetical protein